MFGVLDRYIGRTILNTILMTLFMLVSLSGIIKFVEQLRKVGQGDYSAVSAGMYTLLSIPKDIEIFETFFLGYGGESREQVRERMVRTCTEIMEKDGHNTVLAVSHAGACFNFLSHWQDPFKELKKGFPNCCIFKFEYENGKFTLIETIRNAAI